jgi:hypothetical protein
MARGLMVFDQLRQHGRHPATEVFGERAAGMERAPCRWVGRVGYFSGEGRNFSGRLDFGVGDGDRLL